MKKMGKKAIAAALAAAMATGSLSSVVMAEDANVNKEGTPICNEEITVTVSGCNANTPDWNETDQAQQIREQWGINMECTSYEADAWETQLTLMMASDELTDLVVNCAQPIDKVNGWGEEGYFLPIDEYMDYAPNLQAFFEVYPEYKAGCTAPDGHIYGLVKYNPNPIGKLVRTWIDSEWLQNVGMEAPTNVDELYEVLKAFKEQDANGNGDPDDEIPMSGYFADAEYNILTMIMQAFGIPTHVYNYSKMLDADGNVALGQMTENYKACVTYLNKLYTEGLLDKDIFTQTLDEFRAKVKEGRVGAFGDAAPFVAAGADITIDAKYQYLSGLTSEYNETASAVYMPGVGDTVFTAISAETEYPEAMVSLLDKFYGENGALLGAKGFEGVSWEYVEEPALGNAKLATNLTPEGYASSEEYRYKKATMNNAFYMVGNYEGTQYKALVDSTEEILNSQEVLDKYGWAVLIERLRRNLTEVDEFPTLVYTTEEVERGSSLRTDVKIYLEQTLAQFITGEVNVEEGWENYLKTLDQMGVQELLEIEQAAYDRMSN